MAYLLCALLAMIVACVAHGWAKRYASLLQRGALPVAYTLYAALWQRARPPWQYGVYLHGLASRWQKTCLGLWLLIAMLLVTLYLWVTWHCVMTGRLSLLGGAWYSLLALLLLFLSFCDLYTRLLPDALTLPLMFLPWLGAGLGFAITTPSTVWWWVLATYVLSSHRWLTLKNPPIAGGDIKLYLALWAQNLQTDTALSLLLMACAVCWMVQASWQRRCFPRGACAFGPYLCLAYCVMTIGQASDSAWWFLYRF